ncbi:SDR family oxidoreductase [Pseudactinotalea sp.]|uniref:SDR family oxidoreductase n=1 Tax=Pseudactinotalea sp. TaxID=1926260 RepID=UPI003B3ADC4D
MKIVVVGGTGRIGSRVVADLTEHGHEVLAAAPSTGVDALTGEGLTDALTDAAVVVDLSASPSFDVTAVREFVTTSTTNLISAEREAGVKHHLALTIVGTNRPQEIPYFAAKAVQENLVRSSGLPYTLVHATQFFGFFGSIADVSTEGSVVRLPGALVQPMAAEDVAAAVARAAAGGPRGDIEVAGPRQLGLDEFVRRGLTFRDDPRAVVRDDAAPYFGAQVGERTLLPIEGAEIAPTTFEQWLARTQPPVG